MHVQDKAYKILVGNPKERTLVRTRLRWEEYYDYYFLLVGWD
jgi:hypothetical protein